MTKTILTILAVVSLVSNANAQINMMGGSAKKKNMQGVVVNMGVGVALAATSWGICAVAKTGSVGSDAALSARFAASGAGAGIGGLAMPNISGTGCDSVNSFLKPVSIGVAVLSVMSYVQGATDLMSMASSSGTEGSSSYGGGDYGTLKFDDLVMPDGTVLTGAQMESGLNSLNEAMKKNGMGVDLKKGKVTMPNGNSFDASILGQSPSAIAAATGLPESAVKTALDEMKKATNKQLNNLDKYQLRFAGGGGGSLGVPGEKKEGTGFDLSALFPKKRGPASVAKAEGLQKNIGGAIVGIAQDDIFQMVRRRYQEKAKLDFFYK